MADIKKITPGTVHQWAKKNMKRDEIDTYQSDLYVKVTPLSEYMVKNLWDERYSKPKMFTSQIDKSAWYEFPFCAMGDYIAKKRPAKVHGIRKR